MDREIKFRVWVKRHQHMTTNFSIGEGSNDMFKSDSVEFMQYTGLKDKNGVEIYEDDQYETEVCLSPDGISSAHNNFHWIKVKCTVVFHDGAFVGRWEIKDKTVCGEWKITNRLGYKRIDKYTEITGNAHQNPELLD